MTTGPVEALRSAWRTRGPRSQTWLGRLSWLAYGTGLAFIYNGWLNSHQATSFTCQRYTDVANAIRALNAGAPVLTGLSPGGGYAPAGYGDDAGPYLYLPILGHLTGTSDPVVLYRWMFIGLLSFLLIVWPLMMRSLFGSRAAGIVLPAILLPLLIGLPGNINQYWIASWCVALCLPLVLMATRTESRRRRIALLLIASVVAGFSQSMRANAGIAIPIAGVLAVLWRERAWRRRAVVGLAVVAVYWMAGSGVIRVANAVRDGEIGNHALSASFKNNFGGNDMSSRDGGGHVLWHAVYLGLGFEPNRYGIRFADSAGINYARSVDPTVKYLSPEYATILRKRIIHLALNDPGFVLGTTVDKASVVLATGLGHSFPILLLLPLIALLGSRTLPIRRWLLLCIPSLLVSFAAPTLVVPIDSYMLAFNGVMRFVLLLEIGWAVTELAAAYARQPASQMTDVSQLGRRLAHFARHAAHSDVFFAPGRRRARSDEARTGVRGRLTSLVATRRSRIAVAVIVVEALGGAWAATSFASLRTAQYYVAGDQLPLKAPFSDPSSVRSWSMATGLPADWTAVRGHVSSAGAGRTIFDTSPSKYATQLVGPEITLGPGNYAVDIDGRIMSGGMSVSVQSLSTTLFHTISSHSYSYRVPATTVNTTFHLDKATAARIVLANLSPGTSSHWKLTGARIGMTTAHVINVAPKESALQRCTVKTAATTTSGVVSAPTAPSGQRVLGWDFSRAQPQWRAVHGASTSTARHETAVSNGQGSYDYQLVGPVFTLPTGSYRVDMLGSVSTGTIQFLALDVAQRSFVGRSSPVASGLPGQTPQVSSLSFTLSQPATLRLIFGNDNRSTSVAPTWLIKSLDVYRVR